MLTYSSLLFLQVKTSQAGRLRVNMGNIYYDQGKYDEAIVLYNMALDMLPAATKEIKSTFNMGHVTHLHRFKIQRNIANCLIHQGKYSEASTLLEGILEASPDPKSGKRLALIFLTLI